MLLSVAGAGCSGSLSRRNSSMRVRIVLKSSAARVRDIRASALRTNLRRDLMAGEVFEDADQAGMVPALAAERGGGVEQFLGGRGIG